jgi:hypothetical protein
MKHPLALSGFLLLAVLGSPLCAQTLNWGSPIGTLITDSNGDGVDDTFIFELGAFALDFTPDEDNVEDWALNWKMFDTATYNPAFGYLTSTVHVVGDVSGGVTSSNPAADPGNFSGLVAYLWIRNSDQPVEGSEWLVVRADNWTFPVTAGDCCDTSVIEWSISDLDTGDTPLWGRQGGVSGPGVYTPGTTGTPGMQTFTFVPEPSSALMAGLAAIAAVMRRRRNDR